MNDLNLIQLAAKDALVYKYRYQILSWSAQAWTKAVNDMMCQILDLDLDTQFEILSRYRKIS